MEPLNRKEIMEKDPSLSTEELDEYESLMLKQWDEEGLTPEETLRLASLFNKIFKKEPSPNKGVSWDAENKQAPGKKN